MMGVMMEKVLFRLRNVKQDERGETLPGLLVNSVVSAFVLVGVGLFIFSAFSTSNGAGEQAALSSTVSALNNSFRDDVLSASQISSVSDKNVTFTVPGSGVCRRVSWDVKNVGSNVGIVRTVESFASNDVNVRTGAVSCSGASTQASIVVAPEVDGAAVFKLSNYSGRQVRVIGPNGYALGSEGVRASGVSDAQWNRQVIAGVSLEVRVKSPVGDYMSDRVVRLSQVSSLADNPGVPFL